MGVPVRRSAAIGQARHPNLLYPLGYADEMTRFAGVGDNKSPRERTVLRPIRPATLK